MQLQTGIVNVVYDAFLIELLWLLCNIILLVFSSVNAIHFGKVWNKDQLVSLVIKKVLKVGEALGDAKGQFTISYAAQTLEGLTPC